MVRAGLQSPLSRLQTTPWLSVILLLGLLQAASVGMRLHPWNNDSLQWYVGTRSLWLSGDPYQIRAEELPLESDPSVPASKWHYCYPPFFAYCWLPMNALPDVGEASWVWLWLSLALTPVYAWQLADVAGKGKQGRLILLLTGLLLGYSPHVRGISLGQCHVVLGVLLAGCAQAVLRARSVLGGLLLALAVLIKLFPGLWLVVLWCGGQRRAALVALLGMGLFSVLTWDEGVRWVREYLLPGFYPLASAFNISWHGMAERLFRHSVYATPLLDSVLAKRVFLAIIFSLMLLPLLAWRRRLPPLPQLMAVGLAAMLLLQPFAGIYHLNLLPLALALWRRANPHAPYPWLLVLALGMTAIPVAYFLTESDAPWVVATLAWLKTGWGLWLLTPQTYGLFLCYIILARYQNPPTSESTSSTHQA